MRTRVTDQGIIVPKEMFNGVDEVEKSRRDDTIVIDPVRARDPVFELGENPIDDEVRDASTHHDRFLYGRTMT